MKMLAFAVYDSKAQYYEKPMFARSKGEMLRVFGDVANNKEHPVGAHPEDYSLFLVGEYDQTSGVLTNVPKEVVIGAWEMVKVQAPRLVGEA